jgi:hypothetical protein
MDDSKIYNLENMNLFSVEESNEIEKGVFQCEYCGTEISASEFLTCVAQHGVLFLAGKIDGYIGVTCSNQECLKTILIKHKIEVIRKIREEMFLYAEEGPNTTKPLLRYHSFPYEYRSNSSMEDFYCITGYSKEIIESEKFISEQEVVDLYINFPAIAHDAYCSYFYEDLAISPRISIRFFSENNIQQAANFENETKIKVFPRYRIYDPVVEAMDIFCYGYLLREKIYHDAIEKLKEEFSFFTNLPSENNKEATVAYDFLNVLTMPVSLSIDELEIDKSKDIKKENISDNSLIEEVYSLFKKGLGRDFLNEIYLDFIEEYTVITETVIFKSQIAHFLKSKYLKLLYDRMKIESLNLMQYAFFEEPPTWTIIFDGKPIRGLTQGGFRYINYLVANMRKEFSIVDLNNISGVSLETISSNLKGKFENSDDSEMEPDKSDLKGKKKSDIKNKRKILDELNGLRSDLDQAEINEDIGEQDEIKSKIESIEKYLASTYNPDGTVREINDDIKKTSGRIGVNIKRAINQLKKYNEKAAIHFEDSIQPYANPISYTPRENIKWHFNK